MTPVNRRPRWLERHWLPAIIAALATLALAAGWAIRASYESALEQVHAAQVAACERGNLLRARLQVNVRVLDRLLGEAARVRRAQAAQTDDPALAATSLRAAATYEHLQDITRPVPLVDCERAIERP